MATTSNPNVRTFQDKPAKRERVPLWIGLFGASGSGKTYSALRVAKGIQRVFPGEIYGVDTEACRMLHYSPEFQFRHVEFKAPFAPADYLDAVRHCVDRGASVVVIDSASHVWEGTGGVLEMAEATGRADLGKWIKPKAEHRKMVDGLLQLRTNLIFCFRARSKMKPVTGGQPIDLGFQPIGSDDLVWEMTLNCLLPPGSEGFPTWTPEFRGERAMLKLPSQFRHIFGEKTQPQLTEEIGEQLARWAAGDAAPAKTTTSPASTPAAGELDSRVEDLVAAYETVTSSRVWTECEKGRESIWATVSPADKKRLKSASEKANNRAKTKEGASA